MAKLEFKGYSVDDISKALGAIAIGSYVLGYLVISYHFSRLGFSQTSPFRPRVLETGITATVFFAIPALIGSAVCQIHSRGLSPTWAFLVRVPLVVILSDSAAIIPGFTTEMPKAVDFRSLNSSHSILFICATSACFFAILTVVVLAIIWWWHNYHKKPILSFIVFLTASAAFSAPRFLYWREAQSTFFLWFLVLATVVSLQKGHAKDAEEVRSRLSPEEYLRKYRDILEKNKLETSIMHLEAFLHLQSPVTGFAIVVVLVAGYTNWIYPSVPFSLAGGQTVPVSLYIKSPGKPDHLIRSRLLDESEQGFYLLFPGGSKGVFVPRERIDAISFSDEQSDIGNFLE
jgi:hypothetical protein